METYTPFYAKLTDLKPIPSQIIERNQQRSTVVNLQHTIVL